MENEVREVAENLGAALGDSGLTQAEFATALGTSASRLCTYLSGRVMPSAGFYLRALKLAGHLRQAREQGWMTPQSLVREVRRALRDGDEIWALRMALQARDHLVELLREQGGACGAWAGEPPSTGDLRWDVLLAALVASTFRQFDRDPPGWAALDGGHRRLDPLHEWVLPSLLFSEAEVRASTPAWLRERGIYASEHDLATA